MVIGSSVGANYNPQQNAMQVTVMPAPTKGIDARAPTGNMPSDVCIYAYNLMPAEYGMLLRDGYREWCIGLDAGASTGVHTLIPFTGVLAGGSDDRLFAITNETIWDVTTLDTPISKYTFASSQPGAGHGVFAHYIDQGGDDFLYYADGINGLFIYSGLSAAVNPDTWDVATGITGPIIGTIVFVMVHKQRMWLVEEGKSSAWYLPISSGQGAAEEFFFGGKFPHGGRVYAMYNWSIDGGKGIDDLLVVVSSSGDVLVYEGSDPTGTDWSVRGTYYIGDLPTGRRVGSEYSGDLYLLSSFGLISMSDLIRGVDTQNPSETSLSFRVARPLREQIRNKKTEYGWEPIFLPAIGQLLITIPQVDSEAWIQYNLTLATEGWGFWRDVPMSCVGDWTGIVFFGTRDGRVCAMDVTRDNILLTPPPEPQLNGNPIDFSLLSSYQNMGSPGIFKRVQMVRPDFYGNSAPAYTIKVLYDYDFNEPDAVIQGDGDAAALDEWDGALWDLAVWSTIAGQSFGSQQLAGTSGLGRSVAIAMRGSSGDALRLITWDIMWLAGGPV